MNDTEKKVLHTLADHGEEWCLPFDPICAEWGLERKLVRRACRSLARKGLTAFEKGLWSEDGEPAGAGYRITKAGIENFKSIVSG